MFDPLSFFAFCRIFTLFLYLSRLHIILCRLLPLFVLFCLLDVRCALSTSIGHSQPSFSWNSCSVSLHNPPMSPLNFLQYYLLSGCFALVYPLELLASPRHSPNQSDSHISLQLGVRYLLVYFQHCSLFIPFGSLRILLYFLSDLIPLFQFLRFAAWLLRSFHWKGLRYFFLFERNLLWIPSLLILLNLSHL